MSTFTASQYVKARKGYTCTDCGNLIDEGDRHLVFRPGLITRVRVCASCSVKVNPDNWPKYYCQAVVDAIKAGDTILKKVGEQ